MKERPILFSAAMARAIFAGAKTQTRRPIAFPRTRDAFVLVESATGGWWPYESDDGESELCGDGMEHPYSSPFGGPGDQLWVRENGWERPERTPKMLREGADTWAPYYYDADGITEQEAADLKAWGFKRRPSIHMPRWASRITLEVTGVRGERLHDISAADCRAEGCTGGHGSISGYAYNATPHEHFRHTWRQINGSGSWEANPWVWVIEFRRI